jgi:hypothetical protein
MVKLQSLAQLGCACCGTVDDVIQAEVAKFGTTPLTRFAVHFTPSSTGKDEVRHVNAPTPDAAREVVAEAYRPSTIYVKKIKRTA